MMRRLAMLVLALGAGLLDPAASAQEVALTPNAFFGRGTPTFVYGTAGDDDADRRTRVQADLVRSMIFPKARLIPDTAIDVSKGPKGWPPNPVLYGGTHVNRVLAALGDALPFSMEAGKMQLGDWTFNGDEYRIITVVPGSTSHPAFLLYAGNGTPGVGEINGLRHGGNAILIGDRFGPLMTGTWARDPKGHPVARLGSKARRIEWRTTTLSDSGPPKIALTLHRPKQIPAREGEFEEYAACLRGVQRAAARIEVTTPVALSIYFYPDRRSKQSLTTKPGDGHADPISRTLHVLSPGKGRDRLLEQLVAHEATHVVGYDAWGPAGTPLLGEGLAVWAAGEYAGRRLETWRPLLPKKTPAVADLLGAGFRKLPEQQAYPLAGLLTGALIEMVGAGAFRTHLLPATATSWEAACESAGTTPSKVEAQLHTILDIK